MFNIFRSPKLSDGYKYEIDNSKEGLDRLIQLTAQLEKEETERDKYIGLLNTIADNLGLNVWIKDKTGALIYINESAAKNIFKSDPATILHMKDSDFANDELAQVCMTTDKITIRLQLIKINRVDL
jgi:transcriptional regulator with PAS, ATPase and Fis domain